MQTLNERRNRLKEILRPILGKDIINRATSLPARLSVKGVNKMSSGKAIEKSKTNGFSPENHFEAAEKIKELYENAELVAVHKDLKIMNNPNLKSIKRFVAQTELSSGTKIDALITVKQSVQTGHRIYSIELDQINKVSSRWQAESSVTNNADIVPTTGNPL